MKMLHSVAGFWMEKKGEFICPVKLQDVPSFAASLKFLLEKKTNRKINSKRAPESREWIRASPSEIQKSMLVKLCL